MKDELGCGCLIFIALGLLSAIPAWLTHVYVTITNEQWIFLLAGAFFFPIGIVHGWGIWLGIF